MAGLFIVLLIILAVQYWYVAVGAVALWLLWCLVLEPARKREIEQAQERQRDQRARAEIDAVTAATQRAMVDATRQGRS
jgi:type IV secretory pathway TrbD component